MTDATQTATTDAREASKSRVTTQDDILSKLTPPEAAKEPADVKTEAEQKKDEGEHKAKKSPHERIQELVKQRKEAEAKADAEKRRADELEARVQGLTASAKPLEEEPRPLRSKFSTDDDYIEAVSDWKAKQAIQKREQEQAQARQDAEAAQVAEAYSKRQDAVMQTIPDYADVIGKSETQIPAHVHLAIMESEQGPQIAYYLALEPEEAKRIAQMKPIAAIKRIAALERELAEIDDEDEPAPKAKEAPKEHQKSKAPPPIEPVKSTPSSSGGQTSFEEYKRRRQAEQRK